MSTEELVKLVIVGAVPLLVVELARSFLQRPKMRADVAGEISAGALVLLKPLRERVQECEKEAAHLRTELHAARIEIAELRGKAPPEPLPEDGT